ncbi:MAG: PTS sugar transporter subunit IIA [Aquisalinus sp.]|nr:PTS sugar transporter subunit IIA [Aquisalinus sp.]
MIGLVVVTHGNLADEFLKAAVHVVGPQPNMAAVCIGEDDDMERRREDILQAASAVGESGDGTIILTDMFGGTPSNLAISVMDKVGAEVIAGVNLPMLIKLAPEQFRTENNLKDAVTAAHEAGRKYINVASWVLSGEQAS